MAPATAAPPSTPSAPPSVKSFCTSTMNSALVTSASSASPPASAVGQVVAALVEARDERVDRLLRVVAHRAEGEDGESERRPVGGVDDARQRVTVVDPAGLRVDGAARDRVAPGEAVVARAERARLSRHR